MKYRAMLTITVIYSFRLYTWLCILLFICSLIMEFHLQIHFLLIFLLYRTIYCPPAYVPCFFPQRVNQCLRDACRNTENDKMCKFIDCGHGSDDDNLDLDRNAWKINVNASACLTEDGFPYGIYLKAVNLTTQDSVVTRYVYSLFWGFQVSLYSHTALYIYVCIYIYF